MKDLFSVFLLVIAIVIAIPTNPWVERSSVYEHVSGLKALVTVGDNLDEKFPLHFRRDGGRTKCGPSFHVNVDSSKRSIMSAELSNSNYSNSFPMVANSLNHRDLSKRIMTVPKDEATNAEFDEWYDNELRPELSAIYDDTVSTALYKGIANEAISLGISGLCGCTTLVVYSKTAVYIGHYFENLSFDPDAGTPWGSENGFTPQDAFKNTVLLGLKSGIKPTRPGATDGQDALAGHAADFNNKDAKAWLIIPTEGPNENPDPYRSMWNEIKDTILNLYPKITYDEHPYVALSKNNYRDIQLLDNTARGKMLWKFDPLDPETKSRSQPHRLIKFWSEYDLLDTVQW